MLPLYTCTVVVLPCYTVDLALCLADYFQNNSRAPMSSADGIPRMTTDGIPIIIKLFLILFLPLPSSGVTADVILCYTLRCLCSAK